MGNDEFDGEIFDKELVREIFKFSTIPLLYMTENRKKNTEFYWRVSKIDCMAIAWVVFDVCDREVILEAIKHTEGFMIFNRNWRKNEEIAQEAVCLYPKNTCFTDNKIFNLRTWSVKENF